MKCLSNNDLIIFENLLSLSQEGMHRTLHKFLKRYYEKVTYDDNFLFAEGDIPIALVAHMDTVFKTTPGEILYDRRKNIMTATDGLGADDRAGIFSIIKIVKSGLRPHIIFTTDEEVGCIGALALSYFPCPFENLQYIIQLDRRNANDCVFYECDNEEFERYVEGFGFVKAWGSFTDICELCPSWGVAGVNLSIGYKNEHTVSEILYVGQMFDTIEKVKKMLTQKDIPFFKYIPSIMSNWHNYYSSYYQYPTEEDYTFSSIPDIKYRCKKCKKAYSEDNVIPVKLVKGGIGYYCIDCISDNIDWCWKCGEAYELNPNTKKIGLCRDCEKKK